MNVVELPGLAAAYDKVGVYDQDAINGFSPQLLEHMLDFVNPTATSRILDAMAGNGNLTQRLYDYCQCRGITRPQVTLLELSRVQCDLAREKLTYAPVQVVWGNILTMEDYENGTVLPGQAFDRVMLKSGSHEIPLENQLELYTNIL